MLNIKIKLLITFVEKVLLIETKYLYLRIIINQLKPNTMKTKRKLYYRLPAFGNEFPVLDEITDEVIAIFFSQQDAIDYIKLLTN